MKKQNKQLGMVEKLCQFLGRQNFASDFLDYVSAWLFPPVAMAYTGLGTMSKSRFPKNKKDSLLEKQKPIMMAKPPSGTENFRGIAKLKPHKQHDAKNAPLTLVEYIIGVGPVTLATEKKRDQHAITACNDPLYKGMHGAPCKYEGGSNNKCPKGTVAGWWWSYEVPGMGRIYYVDCCGGDPKLGVICNWTNEANWCVGYGKAAAQNITKYTCTLAILEADMNVKKVLKSYEVVGVD